MVGSEATKTLCGIYISELYLIKNGNFMHLFYSYLLFGWSGYLLGSRVNKTGY
jgi:hypothetical protein